MDPDMRKPPRARYTPMALVFMLFASMTYATFLLSIASKADNATVPTMLFLRILAILMILVSLTVQARTEFACGMSAAAMAAHDCCPPGKKAPCAAGIGEKSCCDKVAPSDAPLGHAAAAVDMVDHGGMQIADLPPIFLLAVSALIPSAVDTTGRYHVARDLDAGRYRLRPVYLQTARLRL